MRHHKRILVGALLAASGLQAMACYSVYDRFDRIMYQGEQPPVDMALPIHQTVSARFPGGHMVFDSTTVCRDVAASRLAPGPGNTPLLTNQQTAQTMRVPYTAMAGGLALVRGHTGATRPGLTVLPPTAFATSRRAGNSTNTMGAAPAARR